MCFQVRKMITVKHLNLRVYKYNAVSSHYISINELMIHSRDCTNASDLSSELLKILSQTSVCSSIPAQDTYLNMTSRVSTDLRIQHFSSSSTDHSHHKGHHQQQKQWTPSRLLATSCSTDIRIASVCKQNTSIKDSLSNSIQISHN